MKTNWTQIITLCLCVFLLIVTIIQGNKLREFQQKTENQLNNLRNDVEREIQNIPNDIKYELEASNRLIAEYALEPNGIDPATHSLQAVASITLKEWYEDTDILLLGKVGEDEISFSMTPGGNGTYSANVLLPVNENNAVSLDALISGGGLTQKESIGKWDDLSLLLPLRNNGSGWNGPEYRNGVMSSRFQISIETLNGDPSSIRNPQFLTFRNGELVQTQNAIKDPNSSSSANASYFTVNTADMIWSIECSVGDEIEIRFRCEDEYGLGYDFLFNTWVAEEETPDNQGSAGGSSGGVPLKLYWPG